jgi:hypothetical protein
MVEMADEFYTFLENEEKRYFHIHLSGEIDPEKVGKTFFAITTQKGWLDGVRDIIWDATRAYFPTDFEFGEVLKNALALAPYASEGRSAVLIPPGSEMHEKVVSFYSTLATSLTKREVRFFESLDQAESWIESGA